MGKHAGGWIGVLLLVMLATRGWGAVPQPRALVLEDGALADTDVMLASALRRTLTGAGYRAEAVTVGELRGEALAPEKGCALLVLPQARRLPAPLIAKVEAYVRRGGNLIVLGAPAWQAPTTVLRNGTWQSGEPAAANEALDTPGTPFLSFQPGFPTGQLIRETNADKVPTRFEIFPSGMGDEPGKESDALQVTIPALDGWDMWRTPDLSRTPFEPGQSVTVFSARGGPRTRRLSVEWDERDGSRWIAVVSLSEKWQKYTLSPADFHGWGVSADREKIGFRPENAIRFKAGLAFTHTGTLDGAHEYALAGVGTQAASSAVAPEMASQAPVLETISPTYKFSTVSGSLRLATPQEASPLVIAAHWDSLDAATLALMSSPPRATGAGFGKGRTWRWQPLLVARDAATGQWRGVPATLFINKPDGGVPNAGGVWVSFGIGDAAFYRQPDVQTLIGDLARRIRTGLFLLEGGADAYTILPGQAVHLGATLVNESETEQPVSAHVTVTSAAGGTPVWQQTWRLSAAKRSSAATPAASWTPPAGDMFPTGGYLVTTELLVGTTVIDRLQHRLYRWVPPPTPQFVTIGSDGHFHGEGKLWRACGVNYTPSSGIAQENGDLYQRWLDPAAYDPETVERDLFHIEELGFNAVSAWVYGGEPTWQNLLDFLRRCRAHHLKVSLMLAPDVGSPAAADGLRPLIEKFQLPNNDTLFAYEIAWEPEFNGHDARRTMDGDWEHWVTTTHKSIADAERAWGVPIPRESDGKVTNPPDDTLQGKGPQARLALDYRRFLDDWLTNHYGPITRRLKEIDTHHAVSFRMSYAGDPTARGRVPYQFEGLARAVDYLAPEAYGRVGNWDRVKPGIFTVAYARAVAPTKPIVWAEAGMSVWDVARDGGSVDPDLLTSQGHFYEDFFRMALTSGSDGVFFWWFPGGYRFGESSDYGILNPDGTDRPAAITLRRNVAAFKSAPTPPRSLVSLPFTRDNHPDGLFGVYDSLAPRFWDLVNQGHPPALRREP